MPCHAHLPLWNDKTDTQKIETLHQLILDLYQYQLGDSLSQIIAMLDAHQTTDEKEQHDIAFIKQLIQTHPNIMNMNCEVAHLTASAIIVDLISHKTLLHFHKRLNRWLQVGGHGDYETDFSQVALREAQEETGLPDLAFYPLSKPILPIDYDAHIFPKRGDIPEHYHLDFRYVLTTRQPDAVSPEDGESVEFKWLTFDEALQLIGKDDHAFRRLLQKASDLFEP
jgi:8-oxo-dGTP pyrophosphatase MutT (NUDIX family)